MACKTAKATEVKKCCYLERACTDDCVAYCDNPAKGLGESFGMADITCVRLLAEVANLINITKNASDDDDWDDDEDEDWDDEDEEDEDEELT